MDFILRHLRVASVLIVVGALLTLGIPRFFSSLVTLPSRPILNTIQTNNTVDAEALGLLIQSQLRGLEWNESARRWTDLGLAQFLLANKIEDEMKRMELLGQAEVSLVKGLSLGPSNSFAWTRLAYVDAARNGLSAKVVQKLRMAVSRAPYDRRLVFARLRLIFIAWPQFDEADRPMVLDQTRFAWKLDPRRLTSLAVELGRIGLTRAALFLTPDKLNRFEHLRKVHSKKKL